MSTLRKLPLESLSNRHAASVGPAVASLLRDLAQLMAEQEMNLTSLLNQGLRIEDNFDGAIISYTSNGIADVTDTVAHGLRKTPSYYIVLSMDKGGSVYKSAPFDSLNVYLKNSVASVATTIFVF